MIPWGIGFTRVVDAAATKQDEEEGNRNKKRHRPFENQPKWGIHNEDDQKEKTSTNAFDLVS